MARTTAPPLVDHARLVQPGSAADTILVGSPAWYVWLADTTSFAFVGEQGSFTAHKERRGPSREYWKAYRRRAGRLHRAYLGKSAELTLERLNAVAAELAHGMPAPDEAPPDTASGAAGASIDSLSIPVEPGAQRSAPNLADDRQPLHLLATKLTPPATPPDLVPRPRLAERLDAALGRGHKLILISAPAGFGKTTLLLEWLASRAQNVQVAWLGLDETDNHLGQFLAYLIAALETVRPRVGAAAWPLLRSRAAHPPTQAILTTLVNALAAPADDIMLVLDDYHTITSQVIHEALAFLIDRMPPQMHVIMTSRADPPLPLARLRVRGQFTEVRAADLRFTRDEAVSFFDRVHGVQLPVDAVATLEARTEGWVAGLQMAALSLQQQGAAQISTFISDFTGSHAYVFDYLVDEVFQCQPEAVRTFLMQTAILARLCGPLCAAVTGRDDAQALLKHLERTNLFLISLDSHRHWYRYHQLFRDFLHERLALAVGSEGCALLYRRASAWFEQEGLVSEAIEYALQAEAWGDALRCIAALVASDRLYEYFLDWPRWLAALPDAVLQDDPDLCLRLAWVLMLTGHVEAAERPLDLAEAVWQAASNQPKVGEVLNRRASALCWRRDFLRAMNVAEQAIARLPAESVEQRAMSTFVLGYSDLGLGHVASAVGALLAAHETLQHSSEPFYPLAAALGLARAYQLQGQLRRAAMMYQDLIRRGGAQHQEGPAPHIYLGMLFYEWNDLAVAERTLREGIVAGQQTGRGRYWPTTYNALAQVLGARGDVAQAHSMIEQALASARLLDNPRDIAEAEAQQTWLWLAQGDLPAALRWLTTHALNADDEVPYEHQAEYLMLAHIRIAQEHLAPGTVDMPAIVRLLDRLLRAAVADERMSDRIAILALQALAHAARRAPQQALASLAAALGLAEPEGYIRTFVDGGAPMRALLLTQRAQLPDGEASARLRAYIDRLLAAFSPVVAAAPPSSPLPALLSERERAVLQLIAAGRSVQEIATHLVISAHTARTHVKNIYAKLDAHNRVQALERARALNLL